MHLWNPMCVHLQGHTIFLYLALSNKSTILRDMMLYSSLEVHWCSWGKYCLHLQGWWISQASIQQEASFCLLPAGCLLGLIFSLEDGGGIFLQNISDLPNELYSIMFRKLVLSMFMYVRTSSPTYLSNKFFHSTTKKCDIWGFHYSDYQSSGI
jgi:hypothetical protein